MAADERRQLHDLLVLHDLASIEDLLCSDEVGVAKAGDLCLLREVDVTALPGLSIVARARLLELVASLRQPQLKRRRVASVSVEYARSLARSSPGELRTSSDVRRLLAEPLPYPVLVDESQEALLAAATGHFNVAVREPDRAMPELAGLLEFAFSCSHVTGGTEEVWASLADGLTGCVWRTLSAFDGTFAFVDNRNSTDHSGATQKSLRPDYCAWSNHALVMKAEHKGAPQDLALALSELSSKMQTWSVLTTRGLPFLPCYAVGGELLQFAIVLGEPGGGVRLELTSDPLNMRLPAHRLRILSSSFHLFRILCWLRGRMPDSVPQLYAAHGRADGGSVTLFDSHVVKRCLRLAPPQVYALLDGVTIPCAIRVLSCELPKRECDFGRIKTAPLGLEAPPRDEGGLRSAVRCALRALCGLHARGFCHRDVRWSNLLRTAEDDWLLIDFEAADAIGQPLQEGLVRPELVAPEARSAGAPYVAEDDIWQVGMLLTSAGCTLSAEAEAFAAALTAERGARPSSAAALKMAWLSF